MDDSDSESEGSEAKRRRGAADAAPAAASAPMQTEVPADAVPAAFLARFREDLGGLGLPADHQEAVSRLVGRLEGPVRGLRGARAGAEPYARPPQQAAWDAQ